MFTQDGTELSGWGSQWEPKPEQSGEQKGKGRVDANIQGSNYSYTRTLGLEASIQFDSGFGMSSPLPILYDIHTGRVQMHSHTSCSPFEWFYAVGQHVKLGTWETIGDGYIKKIVAHQTFSLLDGLSLFVCIHKSIPRMVLLGFQPPNEDSNTWLDWGRTKNEADRIG